MAYVRAIWLEQIRWSIEKTIWIQWRVCYVGTYTQILEIFFSSLILLQRVFQESWKVKKSEIAGNYDLSKL